MRGLSFSNLVLKSVVYGWQVGLAYLLALENANNLTISPTENIEYDRWVI